MAKSFAVEVIADNSGEFLRNDLRYQTKEMAADAARDLMSRWTAVREWRVIESKVAPNRFAPVTDQQISDGVIKNLQDDSGCNG